jgi:hypothetical protein
MRLSLLKILVFVVSGFLLYRSLNFATVKNIANCWSNQFSINSGDSLIIYANHFKQQKKSFIILYDINGKALDSVEVDLSNNPPKINDEWIKGQNYSGKVNYKCNLEPGLYHLEQYFSFCVRNPKAKINIIVPHIFQLCSSNSSGASFYSPLGSIKSNAELINPHTKIPFVINYTKSSLKIANLQYLHHFLTQQYPNEQIGFVSDMDIQQLDISKTYIYCGNYTFMESKVADQVDEFVKKGGNLVIAACSIMNNRVRIDRDKHLISFYGLSGKDPIKDSVNSAIRFNDSLSSQKNYEIIGMDYMFADKPVNGYFKFCNQTDSFLVKAPYFNGIPLKENCLADTKICKFDRIEILATSNCFYKENPGKGTIGVLYKGKGKIIQLPTEEWFNKENLKNSAIKNLTLKLLDPILKK